MINIPLQPLANQSFSFFGQVTIDDARYVITIKDIGGGSMIYNVVIDDTPVISGHRATAGVPLLPYRYLERGNFIFITENEENPNYLNFGSSNSLVYASPEELRALRG